MPEPSPGPLSLQFGKVKQVELADDHMSTIDDEEFDNISIDLSNEDSDPLASDDEEQEQPEEAKEDIVEEQPEEVKEDSVEEHIKELVLQEKDSDLDEAEPEAEAEPAQEPEAEAEPAQEPEAEAEPAQEPEAEAEPVKEPEAKGEQQECDVVYFTDVNPVSVTDTFLDMRKVGGIYFVPLKQPLMVQTPVLELLERVDHKGTTSLKLTAGFEKFVKDLEAGIKTAAIVNKSKWFRVDLDDDIITDSFKSFVTDGVLKVKMSDEFASFDVKGNYIENKDVCVPTGVRCILELSGVCFGKMEFGVMFTLAQLQMNKIPRCVIKQDKHKDELAFSDEFV